MESLSDERLAAIEERWTENGMIHGDIHVLTQEVRRLSEALKEIIRLAEEPHLQIARAGEVALAALDQEAVREEGEKE